MKEPRPLECRPTAIGVLIGLTCFVGVDLFLIIVGAINGDPWRLYRDPLIKEGFGEVKWNVQLVVVAFCGMIRAGGMHPASNMPYRKWLKTTPWDSSKKLPLGAAHVRVLDWLILFAWAVQVGIFLQRNPVQMLVVFLMGYLLVLLYSFIKSDEEGATLVIAFGLAGIVRLWEWPNVAAALALVLYGVAYFGIKRSLARFPWSEKEKPLVADFGWPLQQLGPKRKEVEISFGSAAAAALLVAWWMHAIIYHTGHRVMDDGDRVRVVALMAFLGLLVGLIRLGIYVIGYASPIGMRGRLWTGRLIIPSHDKAWWSAALVPMIAAGAAWVGFIQLHLPAEHSVPGIFFVVLLAALTLPPSRRQYQLTGEHRIVPPRPMNMPVETQPVH